MRNRLLAATAAWLTAAGLALAQPAAKDTPIDPGNSLAAPGLVPAAPCPEPAACAPMGWARAEYLFWRVKDGPVPVPLAALGGLTPGGPPVVVLGGRDADFGHASGARLGGGLWLDAERTLAVEASAFLLEKVSDSAGVGSDATGSPLLTRPFIDATTGRPAAFPVAVPGLLAGSLSLDTHSRLWGADANLRYALCCGCDGRADGLVGFRYLGLGEKLVVDQRAGIAPGVLRDRFYTTNHFFGAQVGAAAEYWYDQWFVGAVGKVAAGTTHYRIEATSFGLLVGPTNHGEHTGDTFAWASEAEVRVGCQLTGCVRAYVGYTCLYWDGVMRPGEQIDPVINPAGLSGVAGPPARPRVPERETDFWAHGLTVGVEVRY